MMNQETKKELLLKAFNIKKRFLRMHKSANSGHVGASLSSAEMVTYAMFGCMREGDEIILSKGHAASLLYSALAERGFISEQEIETFYRDETYLAAHPPPNKLRGIPFATGSLGHGLSLAAGLALASRYKKSGKKIFCITSDGELDEGSTWEAASFIAHHGLTNILWMIDRNNLQGFGRTEQVLKVEPLKDRLTVLGFNAAECDGHDFSSMDRAYGEIEHSQQPGVLICKTIKGRGWKLYEDKVDCHYLPMKDEQYDSVQNEITNQYQRAVREL